MERSRVGSLGNDRLFWVKELERLIGYRFSNATLMERVVSVGGNQQLELVGDALLDVVADLWDLDKLSINQNESLNGSPIALYLRDHLIPNGSNRGRMWHGDAVEALLGAVFIDSQMDHAAIERVAFKIWNREKPLGRSISDKTKKLLGASLRKLICTQIILGEREVYNNNRKDDLIHALDRYDRRFVYELSATFLNSNMNYSLVRQRVEQVIASLENDDDSFEPAVAIEPVTEDRSNAGGVGRTVATGVAVVGGAVALLAAYQAFSERSAREEEERRDNRQRQPDREQEQCRMM